MRLAIFGLIRVIFFMFLPSDFDFKPNTICTQGGPGLTWLQMAKIPKMANFGQIWWFLTILRGLYGVGFVVDQKFDIVT